MDILFYVLDSIVRGFIFLIFCMVIIGLAIMIHDLFTNDNDWL